MLYGYICVQVISKALSGVSMVVQEKKRLRGSVSCSFVHLDVWSLRKFGYKHHLEGVYKRQLLILERERERGFCGEHDSFKKVYINQWKSVCSKPRTYSSSDTQLIFKL